jgi:hypothetical protein
MAGVWAAAAVSEEGLVQALVWVVGMEEALEAGLFILCGEPRTLRPTGLTR